MILQAVFVFYVFTLINSAPVIVYNRLIYIGENDANYCETKYGNRSRVMEFLPNTTAEFNYPDPCNIYCYDAIKKKTVKTPREEFSYCGHNKFCVQSMCALSNAVILAHCKDSKREYNFGVPHPTIPCKYFCYLPKDFDKGTWEAINKQEGTPCSTALVKQWQGLKGE